MRHKSNKKFLITLLLFLILFSGCGNRARQEDSTESSSKEYVSKENKEEVIMLSEKVTELEEGLYAVQVKEGEGSYLFGRNFDWMKCEAWIVSSKPETGYISSSTVNMDFIEGVASMLPDNAKTVAALYALLDGMNEKELCVSVNMIEDNERIEQNTQKRYHNNNGSMFFIKSGRKCGGSTGFITTI